MSELAQRIWTLPWPPALRRLAEPIIMQSWLQHLLLPTFLVGVVGLISNERGEILLLRHTYRHTAWGLPTGFLQPGEPPEVAIRREICEEAGLDVEINALWSVEMESRRSLLTIAYTGQFVGGTFRPSDEVSEAQFFAADALPPVIDTQRSLIARYTRGGRAA